MDAPADNPNVTVVGGTTLTTAADGSWASETVWNDGTSGSSGGFSTSYPLPSWQSGINMTGNGGSPAQRNVPDVALIADNVLSIADNGTSYYTSGTSIAAPLWAAFAAMINQQAAANGQPNIGSFNPAIYSLCKSSGYLRAMHDTITGDNTSSSSPTDYYAATGYDLCTGWGTPTGSNTINALLQVANEIDHISWSPLGSPITAGAPFTATVNAQTIYNTLASTFNGTATFSAAQTQTNMLFSRDFESGTITDWNNEGGGYSASIDTAGGAAGTKRSLTLIGGDGANAYNGISHAFANLTPGKVEFYIRVKDAIATAGYFVAGPSKYRTNSVFHFRMDSTGVMGLTDGPGNFYNTNYVANQWYKIDLLLDWTNKIIAYSVNGALVANNIPFCNPAVTSIATANLYNFDNAQVWYDQISFTTASSMAVALSPSGSVRFTNGVWSGPITLPVANTNVTLTASDSAGHMGISNPFVVQAPALVALTVAANPAAGGTVSGGGSFPAGSQQTIAATALSGWGFT